MLNKNTPGQKFFRWLTHAREREARKANNNSDVLRIVEAVSNCMQVPPNNPALHGDYIVYYGHAGHILALEKAGGLVLNKVMSRGRGPVTRFMQHPLVGGVRPSDRLIDNLGPIRGTMNRQEDDFESFIAAMSLVTFDKKALQRASRQVSGIVTSLILQHQLAEIKLDETSEGLIDHLQNKVKLARRDISFAA